MSGRGTLLRRYNKIDWADTVFVHHRQRWSALVQSFVEEFGGQPNYIIRAPGRVNVLGEHIDYSLFVSIVKNPRTTTLMHIHTLSLYCPRQSNRILSLGFARLQRFQTRSPLTSPMPSSRIQTLSSSLLVIKNCGH